ncbi:sensor histidine kinase [Bacteroides thetaiotaomicron]|uniref:sensor histidine kinase n=1 Tax=Bacteroides thetaiotaomicron TaxID=818 RepID=UPI0021647CA3|nr:histidine kinase [Bacteroides thetaiotaomicron]UVR90148.1 histidine kinase [Bacteroides thetaiotaomicron]
MSVKRTLYSALKVIGVFLIISFMVFRGNLVREVGFGFNLSTGINLLMIFTFMGLIYLNTNVLIPKYLFKGRWKAYAVYMGYLIGFMSLFMMSGLYILKQYYKIPDQIVTINPVFFLFLLINVIAFILYFLTFSFTLFFRRWVTDQQLLNNLENNNLQAELTRLKEQVQPDFLSKMLDEAQLLAKKDADKASALIFKLSSLLRYQLYESAREKVFLSDEIRFVTDYLDLEKMCDERLEYKIQVENEVRYIQIPPLLFMPIIEYAVRKEVENEEGTEKHIAIRFQEKEEGLLFTCVYRCMEADTRQRMSQTPVPALDQLQKRLELLYPGHYLLENQYDHQSSCTTSLKLMQ